MKMGISIPKILLEDIPAGEIVNSKIKIDKNKILNPGNMIEMHFRSVGMVWLKAAQCALIERKLKDEKGFRIISWNYMQPQKVIVKIKIIKTNPIIATGAVLAGKIILAAGIVGAVWLTFDKIYLIVEPFVKAANVLVDSPIAKFLIPAGAIAGAILAIKILAKK